MDEKLEIPFTVRNAAMATLHEAHPGQFGKDVFRSVCMVASQKSSDLLPRDKLFPMSIERYHPQPPLLENSPDGEPEA